jgi:hypothetical protein
MSLVTSSAAATASSACSTADFTQFPTTDVFCAVGSISGVPSNTSDALSSCCKSAPVEQFNGDCGYYCLSYDQTVAELQACFMDNGVNPSTIFCSGNQTSSATGTPSGSGVASKTSEANASGTATNGADKTGASAKVSVPGAFAIVGLGMLGMFVVSAFATAIL